MADASLGDLNPPTATTPPTAPATRSVPLPDAPNTGTRRLGVIDTLRGFALLGILVPNIWFFAWPSPLSFDPARVTEVYELTGEPDAPVAAFETAGAITEIAFIGKFMFLFAMLFGAGVVLFSRRYDRPGGRLRDGAGRWYTRCGWLFFFGAIHGFGMWFGDILLHYATAGMGVVWWCRKLKPWKVFTLAGVCYAIGTLGWLALTGMMWLGLNYSDTPPDQIIPQVGPELEVYTDSSVSAMILQRLTSYGFYLFIGPFTFLWQITGLMLLGVGLCRTGFLTAERSTRTYVAAICIGLPVGFAMTIGARYAIGLIDSPITGFIWMSTAQLLGAPISLGYASVLILLVKTGKLTTVTNALANVGRMAFTNYISHTLICTTVFYGHAGGLYAEVPFPMLWLVVVAVWMFNLAFSALWLKHFRFGPLEWFWRSLTYLEFQPMRRQPAASRLAA
ncbi:MAG: DUF418 domain-containing protein [Planctomycetota bacterium]